MSTVVPGSVKLRESSLTPLLILLPQSELAGVIKDLGLPTDNMDLFSVGSAFRVKETGDCMEVIEYFGGNKKLVNFKYNEEFDYDHPGKELKV